MREKLVKFSKPLLLACTALEVWITIGIASTFFFGEYEPPKKPVEE